jgi:glycosyltransferase involved in cell wall biosynthesis
MEAFGEDPRVKSTASLLNHSVFMNLPFTSLKVTRDDCVLFAPIRDTMRNKLDPPRMKIAVSSLTDVSNNDGTTVRAKSVFRLLQKRYDCTLIVRGTQESTSDNVKVIRPSKLWNLQLIPVILRNRFELVYCSNDFWGFFTYFALAKVRPCKVIVEAHGILSVESKLGLPNPRLIDKIKMRYWREKFATKFADCVVALAVDICSYYGRFNKCIFIVDNFIDEQQFAPQISSLARTSDDKQGKNVGLIGPFVERNINNYFLDFVYQNIDRFDPRIKFVVIGHCDYRITHERIRYTGYLSDFQDYVNQLTLLDAVLVPARFPSFGALTKILEPMACSVPVFTTPAGLVSFDHLTPGEDVFICEESEMVNKVNESLFDFNLMESVGKNARRTVETFYSAAANGQKLIRVIEQVRAAT